MAAASKGLEPGLRWVFFWLFVAFYGLSIFEALLSLLRPSNEPVWIPALAVILLTAAGLGVAWTVRLAWVAETGLLAALDRLPIWLPRLLGLAAFAILLPTLFDHWTRVGFDGFSAGMGLLMLAFFCGVEPLARRTQS